MTLNLTAPHLAGRSVTGDIIGNATYLATRHADGSGLAVIGTGLQSRYPAFSSDSRTIFFNDNIDSSAEFVYSVNVDGTNLKQLTQSNYAYCPMVLGKLVLFESTVSPSSNYQIFDMAADGSGMKQLTHDAVSDGLCF